MTLPDQLPASLEKIAIEGANPDSWQKQFNPDLYKQMLQRPDAPIIPWVESLASGLESRGAREKAEHIRAGGFVVQRTLWESDDRLEQFIVAENLLQFLDREYPVFMKKSQKQELQQEFYH